MNQALQKINLLFILFLPFAGQATVDQVIVGEITLEGNHRTKEHIVLRELNFTVGDSIPLSELGFRLERSRQFVMNTGLFNQVRINISQWEIETNLVTIHVDLEEAWFIYPFPTLELADRNFNVWWTEFDHSLRRLNYGIRFYHLNTTGNLDRLKAILQFGYTQQFELKYEFPALDRAQTLRIETGIYYSRNREIAYDTKGNKVQFYRDDDEFQLRRFRTGITLSNRPGIHVFHKLKLEYQQNTISDYVINELNSNYFLNGRSQQKLFFAQYQFIYDNRDIRPYPLHGNYLEGGLRKEGLGIFNHRNGFYLTMEYRQYFSFHRRLSLELINSAQLALIRNHQPYNNFTGLGYGSDYLRGYEFYVMDGLDYGYVKSAFRFELLNRSFDFGKMMPLPSFRTMPLKVYLSLHNDIGYVNDPQFGSINTLGNRLLWGGGVGLNFVVYFDKVFHVEYSFNQLGENGLYLHIKQLF